MSFLATSVAGTFELGEVQLGIDVLIFFGLVLVVLLVVFVVLEVALVLSIFVLFRIELVIRQYTHCVCKRLRVLILLKSKLARQTCKY
jgi:hypothetical protein